MSRDLSDFVAPDVKHIVRTFGPATTSVWFAQQQLPSEQPYLVATNGRFLLGVPAALTRFATCQLEVAALALDPAPPRRATGEKYVFDWPAVPHYNAPSEGLLRWAQRDLAEPLTCSCAGTGFDSCWSCKGSKERTCSCPCGRASHQAPCMSCKDRDGLLPCTRCGLGTLRLGRLHGELIDRSILARLLSLMPSGPVGLFVDRQRTLFRFEVGGVRGVVAFYLDMDDTTGERYASAPVWPPPAQEAPAAK